MSITSKEYKNMSIKEFTKAADKYETDEAGIYKTCRKNYPEILEEVKKENFEYLLDVGCGTGPMISLLSKEFPNKRFVGVDITPKMIEVAKAKKLVNAEFIVGDSENLPFDENTFDIVICSESFHHYPNPDKFFESIYKVLKPGGRLILRDYYAEGIVKFFVNHIEMPLCNLAGHGDVAVYSKNEIKSMVENVGLKLEVIKHVHGFKMHAIIRKDVK